MVRQGESLVLDGTGSSDPDISPSSLSPSSLLGEWNCAVFSTITPSSSDTSCVVTVSSSSSFKATITPSSLSPVGSVFAVTLSVRDGKNVSRVGKSSVYLTITAPNSPKITVTRPSASLRVNPQDSLLLSGTVQLFVPSTLVTWSVDDEAVNSRLPSIAETLVKSSGLPVGVSQFNLLVSGGRLSWKSSPYVFSLSAGGAVASISVMLNRAPHNGTLLSSPMSGLVLDTVFRLSASYWVDMEGDLPLKYEFYTLLNGKNVLKSRSEMLFVESMLPSGSSSNNYLLECWVGVYDSLGGTSSTRVSVTVRFPTSSSSMSSSSLLEKSTSLLSTSLTVGSDSGSSSASSGSSEKMLQSVSLLSSILNWKDCSRVPTACWSLNRHNCSSTANTCGSCLSGYLGVSGDDNSPCVDESSYVSSVSDSSSISRSCRVASDCSGWESCSVSGMCVAKSKSCKVSDCSGHGECVFVDSNSGDQVAQCALLSSMCDAECVCSGGFTGEDCSVSPSEMSTLREIRSQMVLGLLNVVSADDDVSEGGVLSVLSSLSSVTQASSELSLDSSASVLNVLSASLDQAESLGVSPGSLSSNVFGSLNSVAQVQVREGSGSADAGELLMLLDNFTNLMSSQLVVGQSPMDSMNSMFRTRIQPLSFSGSTDGAVATIGSSIPQTQAEILSKAPSTTFSLSNDGDVNVNGSDVSLVSTLVRSSLVDLSSTSRSLSTSDSTSTSVSGQLTSNMLKLRVSGSGASSVSRVVVVLPTLRRQSYPVYESDESVNTTCELNDFRETTHVCHGALGDTEIVHRCNGTAGLLMTKCPRQMVRPSCSVGEGSDYICTVLNYTSTSVSCECLLLYGTSGSGGRSLSTLSESGALEVSVLSLDLSEFIRWLLFHTWWPTLSKKR